MRAILLSLTLLTTPALAEERTWTISTGTYAMAAELVEVRGDIAYLKTGDRVEHIPLARLSAADINYIASLSPPQILPGPADDAPQAIPNAGPTPSAATAAANEYNAAPPVGPILVNPGAPVQQNTQKPVLNPATRQPGAVRSTTPLQPVEELLPVPASNQANRRVVNTTPRTQNTATLNTQNVRRQSANQRQYPTNWSKPNRNRSDNYDQGFGLFGRRGRR